MTSFSSGTGRASFMGAEETTACTGGDGDNGMGGPGDDRIFLQDGPDWVQEFGGADLLVGGRSRDGLAAWDGGEPRPPIYRRRLPPRARLVDGPLGFTPGSAAHKVPTYLHVTFFDASCHVLVLAEKVRPHNVMPAADCRA